LWPPPKPRESLTLAFEQKDLEVQPGEPATYTIFVRAPGSFSGTVTLEAVVLPDTPADNLTWAFAPHGTDPKTGLLAPSLIRSRAALTLQTPVEAKSSNIAIMVSATGGGQTQTVTGSLKVKRRVQGQQSSGSLPAGTQTPPAAQQQNAAEEQAGYSDLAVWFTAFPRIPDEVRLFLIVAVVGCLGGLLQSIRSWFWYAGHNQLEQRWIPFYVSTPIVSMTMAIIFYLLFRAGFISPTTPVAETNTYGFAAIAGLVGLFSNRAAIMLENIADILFAKVARGAGAVSPGDFQLTASPSSQTVPPGSTATYTITVTATQDFSAAVTLTPAVASTHPKGPTVTLSQEELTPTTTGTPVTLTAVTAADTPPGEYKITITAAGGGKRHEVEVLLRVSNGRGADAAPSPDFELSTREPARTVVPGESASYTLVARASGGFSQTVVLAASGQPTGEKVTFSPPSLTPTPEGASSTLTVQTNDTTPPQEYEIKITATDGGKAKETSVKLIVTPTRNHS
jgi:hypothetical protein